MVRIRIEHVEFRGPHSRPRFKPSPSLEKLGFKPRALRHPDGTWFTADEAARFIAEDIEPEIARRRALAAVGRRLLPRSKTVALSVHTVIERYIALKLADEAPANTIRDYRQKARALMLFDSKLDSAPAEALSAAIVYDLYERMRRPPPRGKGLATANAVLRLMRAAFGYALLRGWIKLPANPCASMRMKALPPRVRAGSVAEMETLKAAARAIGRPMVAVSIELGLWTGQRQGDRLDLIERGETATRIVLRQSKTGRLVSIPKAPAAVQTLAEARELKRSMAQRHHNRPVVVGSTIIVNDMTGRRYAKDTYRHDFAAVRAAAVAGVRTEDGGWLVKPCASLADFRDQDLRDTAVTWLARAGCDILEIAAITGHDTDTIHQMLKHYLAEHPERADAAIAKLVAWWDEEMKEQDNG